LKNLSAILFLILYINTALGTCCGEWFVNVKLQVSAKAMCKYIASDPAMDCCKKEPVSCKKNGHNLQSPATTPGLSLTEYTLNVPATIKADLVSSVVVKQLNDYYLTRTAPPREILSLIHVLRI